MRVAQVLHRLTWAGAEVLAADLARALRDRHECVFICLDGVGGLGDALRSEGFAVECVHRRPGLDRRAIRTLAGLWRRYQIDLIHAHQYGPFAYAAMSRGWRRQPRLLFTEHGRHVPDVVSWKRRLANRWLLGPGDAVTAVSEHVKRALVTHEGLPADRIEVIPNGIAPGRFARDAAARARLRSDWGVADDDVLIVQVARFHPVKDHATGARAFAEAVRTAPAKWVLVGDGEGRAAMEQLVRELGVADRVIFTGVRTDIPAVLAASDILMLSSVSEGLPVTVLEAMAAGLPVASTAAGGAVEAVEDGVTGLLTPVADAPALAASLRRLIADAGLRATLGDAGRRRVLAGFSQAAMHAAFATRYDRLARAASIVPRQAR